ncbi:uncharacterized protein LOC115228998 [Octopus sinensis]|uniref:Uncharacterized protein LOC115228998 n=1 Tax=Octopus sinensis TaxID=2607531 RepID=A0A6P7TSP0_9MOLL|nr:uncharacterized protein LOC115228998 [Octopus sinensis]
MSPLLFVLCLEPLSRLLNGRHEQLSITHEGRLFNTNHLVLIDDIKLFDRSSNQLRSMGECVNEFLGKIGLELNFSKSATNLQLYGDLVKVLEDHEGYKYLGITESPKSLILPETKIQIIEGVRKRAAMLCKTHLNARNLFHALNEYAISLLNYYVGIVEFEPQEYDDMDCMIRRVLRENHVYVLAANKERLYLPRAQFGRGLCGVAHLSERILLKMHDHLVSGASVSDRMYAILQTEKARASHLGTIKAYLLAKYGFESERVVDVKGLIKVQKESLIKKINLKVLHKTLFQALDNPHVDVKSSTTWLRYGNNSPRSEELFTYLQDRNFFWNRFKVCPHCKLRCLSVDHIATKCGRMLYHDYTWRHNEVVRSLHLMLCNKYGIRRSRKLRTHKVQSVVENARVCIKVNTSIHTSILVQHNKPDIVVQDKVSGEIPIIEVGITCLDRLTTVEVEKKRKYDLLANELGLMHGCKVFVIPCVMTWEGIVSKYHKGYLRQLGVDRYIQAYMQSTVLKRTLESASVDARRSSPLMPHGQNYRLENALTELFLRPEAEEAGLQTSDADGSSD